MSEQPRRELSRSRPRLVTGPDSEPAGHLCDKCEQREAHTAWGDPMSINHGGGEWRCEVCALTEQLEFARERAAAIPDIERRLDALAEPSDSPTHVDRVAIDPLAVGLNERLLGRFPSVDDPAIGAQERDGWATYVYVSEPHTMAECPFGEDESNLRKV